MVMPTIDCNLQPLADRLNRSLVTAERIMDMTELQLAWAAGFFDGDGSSYARTQWRRKSRTAAHVLVVTAGQMEHRVNEIPPELCSLRSLFGGHFVRSTTGNGMASRPMWQWVVVSQQARHAMAKMLPYLHDAKQEQWDRARVCAADRRELGHAWERERRIAKGRTC
jgi:hypothetical protein